MDEIESVISDALGTPIKIASSQSVSGGCICDSRILKTDVAGSFFVKQYQSKVRLPNESGAENAVDELASMFAKESEGLSQIRKTETLRVPDVIAVGQTESNKSFLVMEVIETGNKLEFGKRLETRPLGFEERFGRSLAMMHRRGTCDRFGFFYDNFIGSNRQKNEFNDQWVEFWLEQRIGYQFELAYQNGFANELSPLLNSFIRRVEHLLSGVDECPALVHGDLWSGNYLVDQSGQPVLIDPAVYFANREAEFGMTTLFGDFGEHFYQAYDEAWPLQTGWEERVEIYRLYHILNHLNLFGASYLSSSLEIIKKYV
jgi:fructosamine-3-kinase